MIIDNCHQLNQKIHNDLFLTNFLSNETDHKRAFISLDLIEDCQIAINEFNNLPENIFPNRSTLYIYGVLQALYCQQDGAFQLYRTIIDNNIKLPIELFKLYNFDKKIRDVRDDIAGHPANRKDGKEFYFIGKGSNSKYKFSYGGYIEKFRRIDVDLVEFIKKQELFITKLLSDIDKTIDEKIKDLKIKFMKVKLLTFLDNLNHPIKLIYEGIIINNHLSAGVGLDIIKDQLNKLKNALKNRYNNQIPGSTSDNIRMIEYIISKFDMWIKTNALSNNLDSEIFHYSLVKQIDELKEILTEIDKEFEI